jgi:tetratricopeptide (TPR) repeat protein
MKRFINYIVAIFFVTLTLPVYAQDRDHIKAQEYVAEQEQFRRSQIMREYDSAILLHDNQRYEAADAKFRHVLSNIKSVPSDLTYYFGKNSYHLKKYQQSIDWLNKYIQLKGTTGQYYADAIEWKRKAEAEFLKEKNAQSARAQEVLSRDYEIDCGPSGKVTCPVCKGNHVVITKGPFGNEYRTCEYCDDHGLLTCAEYNQLIRGELKKK